MPRWLITSLVFFCCAIHFTVAQANEQSPLVFTTLNVPGATDSEANGIGGNGEIVGFYIDAKGVEHGFSYLSGKFTAINFPGATGTRAYGIDLNEIYIVGTYTDAKFTPHGFVLNSAGKFATVDVPGSAWTRAFSVNSLGTIVGAYADLKGAVHGFLDQNGRGMFSTLDFPKAVLTEINSIVNLRYMAGSFVDSFGVEHGVRGAAGQLGSAVNVPGARLTSANGINDGLDIVGHYGASPMPPFHGFLYTGGQFHTINFPNATDTRLHGISDAGEVVGSYTDQQGRVHGFFAK